MPLGHLTIVIQTKALDRVHYALMLAASHAALDGRVHIFFGTEGVETLKSDNWENLQTVAGEHGENYLLKLKKAGAAHPDELLNALCELDVVISACDTALTVAGMTAGSIKKGLKIQTSGLTTALTDAKDGQLIYV